MVRAPPFTCSKGVGADALTEFSIQCLLLLRVPWASILRFSDFEILDLEIFGWSFTSKLWISPTRRRHNPNMDTPRHKLQKKEQNLNVKSVRAL